MNDPMLCAKLTVQHTTWTNLGGWEPGIGDWEVEATGQHLWGLTNGVPLRSPLL